MQPNPITGHLFRIRRAVAAAVAVLQNCAIAERKQRLEARRLTNGEAVDTAALVIARGRTFALRWRAQDAIIHAGATLLVLCAAIDKSLTTAEKLDLLGCRHRCWPLPEFIEFGRLLGGGLEVAPLDWIGTPDLRMGPLKACAVVMLDHAFLAQHAALRPAVEAIEMADKRARDVASKGAYAASRVAAAGALAMPQASRIQ